MIFVGASTKSKTNSIHVSDLPKKLAIEDKTKPLGS
jgi:hypothetical protein